MIVRPSSAGFTLVSAIFLMVVLVVLGVSLVTMSSVSSTTNAQQLQTVRASYAARAGIEWAVKLAATPGGCSGTTSPLTGLGGTLNRFTVSVTCTYTQHQVPTGVNGTTIQKYYVVDVSASSGNYGGPDFVLRKAQVKLLGPAP